MTTFDVTPEQCTTPTAATGMCACPHDCRNRATRIVDRSFLGANDRAAVWPGLAVCDACTFSNDHNHRPMEATAA